MTYYQRAKSNILNDGYFILKEEYSNGVVLFKIVKQTAPDTKTEYCEVAYNIAKRLEKETGKRIVNKEGICHALNFTPVSVPINCIRQAID